MSKLEESAWREASQKAEARIHELEDMVAHPSRFPQYKELEATNDKWQLEFNQKHADLIDVQARIERAKAILKEGFREGDMHDPQQGFGILKVSIHSALAALEGK